MTPMPRAGTSPHQDEEAAGWDTTRKVLNVPLVVGTLAAVAVLGTAAYFWHSRQVDRTAHVLLEKADSEEKSEQWEKAAEYLRRYHRLRPDDAEVLGRLAEAYERSAQTPWKRMRAVDRYYQALAALGKDASHEQRRRLRCRLAELLLELSRLQTGYSTLAEREALLLLGPSDKAKAWQKARADHPELPVAPPEGERWWIDYPEVWAVAQGARLWVLAIDTQVRDGSFEGRSLGHPPFDRQFQRTLDLNPGDIELSRVLAWIYRDRPQLFGEIEPVLTADERAELADTFVNDMVAANPEDPEAFLARYEYRAEYGLPDAQEDLDKALQYGPENVDVLLTAARHASEEAARMGNQGVSADEIDAKHDAACAFCRRAIEAAPSQEEAYVELGEVYRAQGANAQAIEAWRRGLANCDEESLALRSRSVEALIVEGEFDQAKKHLDALDRRASGLVSRLTRESRHVLGSLQDLLQAEWLVAQGRYAEAIPRFKRVTVCRKDSDFQVAQAWQAWQLLGAVYTVLGQWDLAATAHEEASKLEPKGVPAQVKAQTVLSAAKAWSRARCPERAIRLYEEALALEDDPETWMSLARATLQYQAGLPPEARDWAPFDEALAEAKARSESLPEPWQVTLLEVDALVVKDTNGEASQQAVLEAVKRLRQTEERFSDSALLFQALVLVYDRLGMSADADRAMEKVDRLAGESAAAFVLRSGLYSRRGRYEKARDVLAKGAETLPPAARTDLQIGSLQVSLDEGRSEAAYRELLDLHQRSPDDLRFVWQLAQLALERDDLGAVARWEERLRELEGPDGSYWRYLRARRFLARARDADDPLFAEAGKLQASIQSQRWAWPAGHLLAGLLSERRGRYQQAIAAYEKAIQFGEQRISVYERLIALLYRKQRFDEAQRYLSQLQDHAPSSPTLSTLEIHVAAQLGDRARALEAARRGVESRPEDPMARIWLGQMLVRNGQTQEAEDALLEAVRLAPDDRSASEALFTFYVDTGRLDQAREALGRLAESSELSEGERALALAIGYDRIGDREASETHYRELAQLAPNDVAVQKRLATFLLDSDPEGAEKALRRALRLAPEDREVRRALARLLTARGGLTRWQEAQQLIRQGGSPEGASSVDQRLEAQLLVHRGGKDNLKKAKRLIEQLVRDPETAIPQDHLLLANLYEWEGKPYAADREYGALVEWAEPEPAHLIAYVDFLLRNDRRYDANRWLTRLDHRLPKWLARLEKMAPDRVEAVRFQVRLDAMRLRARWLRADGRDSEIKPLVDQFADDLLKKAGSDPEEKASVYLGIGNLYSAVEQHEEAERWYQLLADLIPEAYEPLAMAKARQGRIGPAIQICIQAAESDDSARPAIVMARVLESTHPSPEDLRLADPLLSTAVENHPDNVELLALVAYVRFLQQRIDDAVHLYKSALKWKPDDVVILNNLATLLCEQPARRKEALRYIDKAIGIAGPKPGLLDAKGTILLFDGKAEEAVTLLEEATSLGTDPRFLFHLAVAYQRTRERDKARDTLHEAKQGHLTDQHLTQTDKRLLAELEETLGR